MANKAEPVAATLLRRARVLPPPVAEGLTATVARLIGGAFGLPISWLASASIGIEGYGKGLLRSDAMRASAEIILDDPDIVDRAVWSLIGEGLRKQLNKESICSRLVTTVERAVEDGNCDRISEPAADWMNGFIRLAEDASSDEKRNLFCLALYKQVGHSCKVSLQTLGVLDLLDTDLMNEYSAFISHLVLDFVLVGSDGVGLDLGTIARLERAGLIVGLTTTRSKAIELGGDKPAHIIDGHLGLALRGTAPLTIQVYLLTLLGQEVMAFLPARDVERAMRQLSKRLAAGPVTEINLVEVSPDARSARIKEPLWKAPIAAAGSGLKYNVSLKNGSRS